MAKEIERKFLVRGDGWRKAREAVACRQGYLCRGAEVAVRVRVMDGVGTITIKSAAAGFTRDEFEYGIPLADAEYLLDSVCVGRTIEKTRHYVEHEGLTWEVDEFRGQNEGLVVAEVELESESQPVVLPPWVGLEVSSDPRYLNSELCVKPYRDW